MAEQSLNIFERDPNEMNKYLEVRFFKLKNISYKWFPFRNDCFSTPILINIVLFNKL